jgi:hypothetical protein
LIKEKIYQGRSATFPRYVSTKLDKLSSDLKRVDIDCAHGFIHQPNIVALAEKPN